MRIAVLGTGMVGQTLAGRLEELGHDVTVGTRDPEAARARATPASRAHRRSASGTPSTPGSGWRPSLPPPSMPT